MASVNFSKTRCILFTVLRVTRAGRSHRSAIQTVTVDATPVDGQALVCITVVGRQELATAAVVKGELSCVASARLLQQYTLTGRIYLGCSFSSAV